MKNSQLIGILVASIIIGGTGLLGTGFFLDNQNLNSQLQDTTSDYQELLSEYEELNNSYNNLLGQYDTLLDVHDTLTSDYTSVTNQYNEAMNALNETIENCKLLNQTYNDLILEYQSLNTSYYILTGEHMNLSSDYYELVDQQEELNQTYYGLIANYELLESQNATMTLLYSELSNDYDTLQILYTELTNDYNMLQSNFNGLVNDFNNLEDAYSVLNLEKLALEDEIFALQDSYDSLQSNLDILQGEYDALEVDHLLLYTELQSLNETYIELSNEYEILESQYQNLSIFYYILQDDYQLLNDTYTTITLLIRQQILPIQYCLFAEAVRRYYMPLYLDKVTTKEQFMGLAEFCRDIVLHDSGQYNAFSDVSNALYDVLKYGNDTMGLAWQIMYNVFYSYDAQQRWLPNWGGWSLTGNNLTDIDTVHQWCVDTIDYEYDSDITLFQYPSAGDYVKFPVETAFRTMGDCEDQAILDAAYLESCGFDTAIAIIHDPTHPTHGSFYHGTLLVSIEDTNAFWLQYPFAPLWIFSGDPDNNYWCWLDPTWDVPFGSVPAWLQGYRDNPGTLTSDIVSFAFCDVGGAVI